MEELVGGGGDHACSSGGYTAGSGEPDIIAGKNGSGSSNSRGDIGAGGGYYSKGGTCDLPSYFNQGGMWCGHYDWGKDYSGSGGKAGSGGTICYSQTCEIFAYNGNRITESDFDYSENYYGYDDDGNLKDSGTPLEVLQRPDKKNIIPAFIFAQSGTSRAVYRKNSHMTEAECLEYGATFCTDNFSVENVMIKDETTTITTGYSDSKFQGYGYLSNQGIGSGAGYLEVSNGTFGPIGE